MHQHRWGAGAVFGYEVGVVVFDFNVEDVDAFGMGFVNGGDHALERAGRAFDLVADLEVFGGEELAGLDQREGMFVCGFQRLSAAVVGCKLENAKMIGTAAVGLKNSLPAEVVAELVAR